MGPALRDPESLGHGTWGEGLGTPVWGPGRALPGWREAFDSRALGGSLDLALDWPSRKKPALEMGGSLGQTVLTARAHLGLSAIQRAIWWGRC